MLKFYSMAMIAVAVIWSTDASAQGASWLQVEARQNEAQARERANDYAARLPDVSGFRLASGWYAVVLGPYPEAEAAARLAQLRFSRAVPIDSFLSDGDNFRARYFGSDDVVAVAAEPIDPLPPLKAGEETPAEARTAERAMSRDERELVQIALRWEGFYNSSIDASFGPGTRRAMSTWQESVRFEPTGVLTTNQRRQLLEGYLNALEALNMTPLIESNAGIEINLPTGLVEFDRYEPPFAHFTSKTDDGVTALLISQTGDAATLQALYDIMQTLEIVPLDGSRAFRRRDFTLTGENDRIVSHTYARLEGDAIKGFTLIWPTGDEKRRRLALSSMEESFRATDGVLPDTAGSAAQNIDLLAGLEIRRPERSRSGFYVDAAGAVLTTAAAVSQCSRITLDDDIDAEVAAEDASLGLALLRPVQALAPLAIASLAANEPRLQSDVAVAGYSFGGVLGAPSLTYGTFADVKGLDGDARVQRLEVASEPGDAGGPVFDGFGAVMGMLLDSSNNGRTLPAGVAFAADAPVLAAFLIANGLDLPASSETDDIAPEDLTLLAADMTVLVSCWN
jgi:peptidoglycan hydrolase-like protein with peptidoglycan-binding domain